MGKRINAVKGVIGFTSSIGAGMIVANAIAATTPPHLKLIPTILIRVGGVALASGVGRFAEAESSKTIDDIVSAFTVGKKAIDEIDTAIKNEGQ